VSAPFSPSQDRSSTANASSSHTVNTSSAHSANVNSARTAIGSSGLGGGRPHVTAVKFVVAGGFGVGKTTFVGSISEVEPLSTEAAMTVVAGEVDNHLAVGHTAKTTTTVALDFGRLTVDEALVMYLFGAPGQGRFSFLWDDLVNGALGAVLLVDTRRVEDCFAAVDYFEQKRLPFVVGVNCFDNAPRYPLEEVREALGVAKAVPFIEMDARVRSSCRDTLLVLLELLVDRLGAPSAI
jgi:signal recognition particle receptor subunit beta